MTWFRVDDGMLDHPKWKRAIKSGGDAVVHLWLALGTWCSRHLTDGLVPADMLLEIPGPKGKRTRERALAALLEQRLLVQHIDGGVLLHDYLDYNPSRADVLAERERWAASKRKHRSPAPLPTSVPGLDFVGPGGTPLETPMRSPDVPSRPVAFPPVAAPVDAREARPKRQRTRLPEHLQPNEATLKHARKHGVDWALEEERFKDHHRSKATLSADWQASMRTWIGNAPKFAPTQQRTATKGGPQPWMFEELERARREEAAE